MPASIPRTCRSGTLAAVSKVKRKCIQICQNYVYRKRPISELQW